MFYSCVFLLFQTVLNPKVKDTAKGADLKAIEEGIKKMNEDANRRSGDKPENEELVKRLCALAKDCAKLGLF